MDQLFDCIGLCRCFWWATAEIRIIQVDLGNMVVELDETVDLAMLSAELAKVRSTSNSGNIRGESDIVNIIATEDANILSLYGRYFPIRLSTVLLNTKPDGCINQTDHLLVCDDAFVVASTDRTMFRRLLPSFVNKKDVNEAIHEFLKKKTENKNLLIKYEHRQSYINGKHSALMAATDTITSKVYYYRPGYDVHIRPGSCSPTDDERGGDRQDIANKFCIKNHTGRLDPTKQEVEILLAQPYGRGDTTTSLEWAQIAIPIEAMPLGEVFEKINVTSSRYQFSATLQGLKEPDMANHIQACGYVALYACAVVPRLSTFYSASPETVYCLNIAGNWEIPEVADLTLSTMTTSKFSSVTPWKILGSQKDTCVNGKDEKIGFLGEIDGENVVPLNLTGLKFEKGNEVFDLDVRGATFFIGAAKAPKGQKPELKVTRNSSLCFYPKISNIGVMADVLFRFH